jgi:sensor histidine kinase regulating citrate/malate metabolism
MHVQIETYSYCDVLDNELLHAATVSSLLIMFIVFISTLRLCPSLQPTTLNLHSEPIQQLRQRERFPNSIREAFME